MESERRFHHFGDSIHIKGECGCGEGFGHGFEGEPFLGHRSWSCLDRQSFLEQRRRNLFLRLLFAFKENRPVPWLLPWNGFKWTGLIWMPPCRATRTWEASSGAACSCHRLRMLGRCHGITSDGESRNLRNRHPVLSVKTSVVGSGEVTLLNILTQLIRSIEAISLAILADVDLHPSTHQSPPFGSRGSFNPLLRFRSKSSRFCVIMENIGG